MKLHTFYSLSVYFDTLSKSFVSCSIARYVVRRVDVKFDTSLLKDLSYSDNCEPYTGDECHSRYRTYFVEVVFQAYASIYKWCARVYHYVCELEQVLSTRVTRFLVTGVACRTVNDNFHTKFFGFKSYVDVYSVDTCV